MAFCYLCGTISANPVPFSFMATVNVEKDGIPYNGSIYYTLKCYGHPSKNLQSTEYLRNITKDEPNPPQLVFSASTRDHHWVTGQCDTCHYGYLGMQEPGDSEMCMLTGWAGNEAFSVWNSTTRPAVTHSKPLRGSLEYYDFYFSLPSAKQVWEMKADPRGDSLFSGNPVSSLYCSLLSLFGAKC